MNQKRKRNNYYILFSTLAIVIIAFILIRPLLKDNDPEPDPPGISKPVLKTATNPHVGALIREYETEIRKLLKRSGTPGAAVSIVKDSAIVYIKGFGLRASNRSDSVNINTAFRLASVSKPFASFITGILVEDGELGWQDAIVKHVPGFQLKTEEQTAKLNITHVLSHTTGLPYHTYTNLVEEGYDLSRLLGELKEVRLSNDVGKEYSYQNVAYSVIAEVIRSATGKSYEENLREKVFVPLGMNDASVDYNSFTSNTNIAQPHRLSRRRWVPGKINDTYYNVAPAGGMNASIKDMSEWMKALLGFREDVIRRNTLEHLFTPVIEARSRNRNYRKYQRIRKAYYGLGWRIIHFTSDTLVYHGGFVTGYRSEIAINPHDKIAICVLANAPGNFADNAIPVFFELLDKYRKKISEWDKLQGGNPL